MARLLISVIATILVCSSASAQEGRVELRLIDKFPDDYLGKTVETTAWLYSDFLNKSDVLAGYYTVAINDKDKNLPSYGTSSGLVRARMNYVVSKEQAKQIVKEIDRDVPGKRSIKIAITKENINGVPYYIGRIVEISK
ncbi:MAG: hypothetical protein K2R98_05815 [Gemmataceae bacterium]|nr:hypothetical protein [Gemmataceae bacterium]